MQSRIGGLMNTDIKKQLDSICNILDFHKGHAITTVDLAEQSVIADYFVIADGATAQQVKSMADYLEEGMDKLQLRPIRIGVPRIRRDCVRALLNCGIRQGQ